MENTTEGELVVAPLKPGYKTTEFWVTLITQILGIVALFGKFTPEQATALTSAMIQIAGAVSTAAASFGYSLSRGRAKELGG